MPLPIGAIVAGAAKGIAAWSEAVEVGQNVVGYQGALGSAARAACDAYRKLPLPVKIGFAAASLTAEAVCGDYFAGQGIPSTDWSPSPSGAPPFTGGQCPGVEYTVTILQETENPCGASNRTLTRTGIGPIQGLIVIGGDTRVLAHAGGNSNVGATSSFECGEISHTITNVVPRFGGPDNCGDPPAPFTPGPGGNNPPINNYGDDYTYTDPDGRDFNIKINPPTVGPDGDLRIPIEIDGVEIDLSPAPNGSPPSAKPDFDGLAESDGRDVPPGGEEEDNEPVAAVIVVVTAVPPNRSIEVGPSPESYLYGPGFDAGWLRFSYPTEEGILGRESRKRISEGVQILFPERGAAFGYQLKMAYGFSGRVYPVRVKV